MYMDLTDMISGGTEEQQIPEQKLTKEEYAAKKQQEREEVWAEVDSQAQGVFQDGEKLKGFLDFMAECNTQRTPNLLLIYGQHPDFKVVRSYERWREEHRSVKAGEHGITYMISTEYEKDGEMRRGYTIGKGFDISQMTGKPLEERPQRSLTELVGAVLKDQSVRVQIEDNLPDKVQAQYNPRYRTIYIRNGMSEVTTFHALNRELACAAMDQHTGTYSRQKVSAQAYCAAYVIAKRYGVDVTGFNLEYIAQRNECGKKDPQELRDFLNDDKDVLKLINNLIRNTTPKGAQSSDPFWEKSETALLQALMLYLLHEAPPEEQNFPMIMEMLGSAQVKEDDEDYQSPLDILFERLEMRDPESIAVKQYAIYKQPNSFYGQ